MKLFAYALSFFLLGDGTAEQPMQAINQSEQIMRGKNAAVYPRALICSLVFTLCSNIWRCLFLGHAIQTCCSNTVLSTAADLLEKE